MGCPFCAGKRAHADNCLQTLNPELSRQWHPVKNGNLTSRDVTGNSNEKVWWTCENNHEWEAAICDRARGRNCPYCSGKRANEENCLANLYPNLAKEWHPTKNKNLTSNNVTAGSNKKVWWKCEKGNDWKAAVATRTKNIGCPHCSNESKTSFPEQQYTFT